MLYFRRAGFRREFLEINEIDGHYIPHAVGASELVASFAHRANRLK
jgi:hypothetical protein